MATLAPSLLRHASGFLACLVSLLLREAKTRGREGEGGMSGDSYVRMSDMTCGGAGLFPDQCSAGWQHQKVHMRQYLGKSRPCDVAELLTK